MWQIEDTLTYLFVVLLPSMWSVGQNTKGQDAHAQSMDDILTIDHLIGGNNRRGNKEILQVPLYTIE